MIIIIIFIGSFIIYDRLMYIFQLPDVLRISEDKVIIAGEYSSGCIICIGNFPFQMEQIPIDGSKDKEDSTGEDSPFDPAFLTKYPKLFLKKHFSQEKADAGKQDRTDEEYDG